MIFFFSMAVIAMEVIPMALPSSYMGYVFMWIPPKKFFVPKIVECISTRASMLTTACFTQVGVAMFPIPNAVSEWTRTKSKKFLQGCFFSFVLFFFYSGCRYFL